MPRRPSPAVVGWLLVGVQVLLLLALWALGDGDDWPTPWPVVAIGRAAFWAGVLVMLAAFATLGSSLTPTPEPRTGGRLRRTGLYAVVRHPIYTGVLLIVVGWVVPSGRWTSLVLGAVAIAFFHAKARWEEGRLAEHYPEYSDYAADVPRFVPRPARLLGGRRGGR